MVAPLFKKGERAKPANYKPVTLTYTCCKIRLEHIVHHHIITHLEELNILSEVQYGFRKDHSCESQFILTIQDLASGLEEGGQIDAVLLDFRKAFDKVPHKRLRLELEHYGVRGESLDWISFLSKGSQRVVCGGSTSGQCEVASGVPQGSVQWPLLFPVYINGLPQQVRSTNRFFADDCLLYRKINSLEDTMIIQDDLVKLQQCKDKWLMCFNPDKCEVPKVTAKKKTLMVDYNIRGTILSVVPAAKYLGVCIDSRLSFNHHIDNVVKKANSIIAFISRTTKLCAHLRKAPVGILLFSMEPTHTAEH